MFLPHVRAARLVVAYLFFTVALVMVPKADVPETLFDEANTPTSEMGIQKAISSWGFRQSGADSVPKMFAQSRRTSARRILVVCAGQLTDSRRFRELFCSLLL